MPLELVTAQGRHIDIDHIPATRLKRYLGQYYRQAQSSVPSTTTIEFTCFHPSIAFMDTRFNLCALLLYSPKYDRVFTLFGGSLKAVLDTLYSLSGRIGEQVVIDNSDNHAKHLEQSEHALTFKDPVRSDFMIKHGLEAWREKRMKLTLEANLLKAGFLQRWQVILR